MKKKRLAAITLTGLILAFVGACGGTGTDAPIQTPPADTTAELPGAVVTPDTDDGQATATGSGSETATTGDENLTVAPDAPSDEAVAASDGEATTAQDGASETPTIGDTASDENTASGQEVAANDTETGSGDEVVDDSDLTDNTGATDEAAKQPIIDLTGDGKWKIEDRGSAVSHTGRSSERRQPDLS